MLIFLIEWIKKEAGDYISKDKRFHIVKTWNTVYGNHWHFIDNNGDYYRDSYYGRCLKDCKHYAEKVVEQELMESKEHLDNFKSECVNNDVTVIIKE
jgi:hypothetical protein